ncbi:MAG: hypothetical protein A2849_02035 [Candidatus Taylorbacteria bacterium RIFCSPHIGHO2_01_FULL_51_15]|uniref:Uncharacterized protein n=1 Tax=Candidatus Taylorbacteria bacterium RIFCSPHIGHO2_01_FULL_51_15 TaxID=1802304 RepID=A0A1G2M8Z8_9BACT|nr:MAG: hypothetical protein A2849_02035 [Candidatus Taylorbacteria bacterium RIFCSPHIGHO2_01_FULL_51_15]
MLLLSTLIRDVEREKRKRLCVFISEPRSYYSPILRGLPREKNERSEFRQYLGVPEGLYSLQAASVIVLSLASNVTSRIVLELRASNDANQDSRYSCHTLGLD